MRTIFDIGSNNGDDIPYYLLKADKVIAFEANPLLCKSIQLRFSREIDAGRVVIENVIVCAAKDAENSSADFYIHKDYDFLSQFPKPEHRAIKNFDRIQILVRTLEDILATYGIPHYAKIDIEHYDNVILSEFFRLGAFPDYISAECHSWQTAATLLQCPVYHGFKLIDGESVQTAHQEREIDTLDGEVTSYSFPHHSAGPFGNDIPGPWYDKKSFKRLLMSERLGWKDMHASSRDRGADIDVSVSMGDRLAHAGDRMMPFLPGYARRIFKKLRKLI